MPPGADAVFHCAAMVSVRSRPTPALVDALAARVSDAAADVEYRSPRTKDQPTSVTDSLVAFRVASGTSCIEPVSGAGANPFAGCDAAAGPVAGGPPFTG